MCIFAADKLLTTKIITTMKKITTVILMSAVMLLTTACDTVQKTLNAVMPDYSNTTTTLGQVLQVDPFLVANVVSCKRMGNDVLLTFNLKNNTGRVLQDVRCGHTGYYQNMEGKTDTGDLIHNLSTSIRIYGGNWDGVVRCDMYPDSYKTYQISISKVSTSARYISLQVGIACGSQQLSKDKAEFVLVPIQ